MGYFKVKAVTICIAANINFRNINQTTILVITVNSTLYYAIMMGDLWEL